MRPLSTILRILGTHATSLLSLGLVMAGEMLITAEWSAPYCMNPEDGATMAPTGMPLPYVVHGGISSLQYNFMPHAYLFDLAALGLCAYPLVRFALGRAGRLRPIAGGIGAGLVLAGLAILLLSMHSGMLRPVWNIGNDYYGRYTEYRPTGLIMSTPGFHDCRPSPFWFAKSERAAARRDIQPSP